MQIEKSFSQLTLFVLFWRPATEGINECFPFYAHHTIAICEVYTKMTWSHKPFIAANEWRK